MNNCTSVKHAALNEDYGIIGVKKCITYIMYILGMG